MKSKNKKKRRFDFDLLFDNKIFLMVISVIGAVFLWYSAYNTYGIEEERVISDVPITIETADIFSRYELEVIEIISPDEMKDRTMDVNIISKSLMLKSCSAKDFSATVDTSMVTQAGTYQLELRISCISPELNVEISSDNVQYITVRFDKVKSRTFTVGNVILNGDLTVAEDYTMETAYSNATEVTLTGPELVLNRIDSVGVSAQVDSTLSSTAIYEGEFVYFDSDMNIIQENTISNDFTSTLLVTVPVKMTKQIKLDVGFNNIPEGYSGKFYTVSPSKITVKGEEEAITDAFKDERYIIGTIDFSKINSASPTYDFELAIGNGIEPTEPLDMVKVTLNLGNIHSKTLSVNSSVSAFNVINDDSSRKVDVVTTALPSITICGPYAQIKSVTEKDIVVSADLSSKESYTGNCVVPAVITVKGHNKCWAYGSYEIEVKIQE